MYSYIGGGVATGDFNNDGLDDLFFVANQSENKLYLNQGNLAFKDITAQSGLRKIPGFDAGVTVVDVNDDGWSDIYISRGGWIQDNNGFANLLYVNQGIKPDGTPTFKEEAADYGLADDNRSIQSTFFDFDGDGDLDVYVSNSPDFEDPAAEVVDLTMAQKDPNTLAMKGSDRLYRNDGGRFSDVSISAGILPDIGFGLNPQVGDLNGDGWLDIYVCNDFRIPDFAYINNQDGTFSDARNSLFKHMSFNSMGSDMGDVNNDGLLDLFTLDMNPEDYIRSKTTMGMTPQSRFEEMVAKNYHYQYMHNMLQVNNGNGTYREISKMARVSETDWSWSCLFADFDLDGYNDLFVTNGVFRDVIDRDANNRILEVVRERGRKPTAADFLEYAKMLPQQKLKNYFLKNKGDLTFENMSSIWSAETPTFSNGATYCDLDGDGDLEVIVNNINQPASILKNLAIEKQRGNFISVKVNGPELNRDGIGTLVKLYLENGQVLIRQLIRSRGFLSAVGKDLHFGLDPNARLTKLEITWPDGKKEQVSDVQLNAQINLDYNAASLPDPGSDPNQVAIFSKIPSDFQHNDPPFDDYQHQILLPHKLSQTGPAVALTDVNGDGLEDVFLGGGHGQPGILALGTTSGAFRKMQSPAFETDRQFEDVGAAFIDLDSDGDQDLYVVSGSYEFRQPSRLLQDRLYINDGRGNFSRSRGLIPDMLFAGSVARPADYDDDGDMDLFVGGRVISGQYPYPPTSYLLENEDGELKISPDFDQKLINLGMITDAVWADIDNDADLDLILTGEWMGVEVITNENGLLKSSNKHETLRQTVGWWNRLCVADIDQDGDLDIIAGNLGLNYKFHASKDKPFHIYTNDFDYNGTVDVFLAKEYKGMEVPVRGKTCTAQQLPHLNAKIPTYEEFANQDLTDIIGPALKNALHYEASEFRSGIFINEGENQFRFAPLANVAQQSPVNGILYEDFDGDGTKDLLLAGNNHMSEIETTRADAGIGILLKGTSDGIFNPINHMQSGFFADKDVRDLVSVSTGNGRIIIVVNNNSKHDFFENQTLNN